MLILIEDLKNKSITIYHSKKLTFSLRRMNQLIGISINRNINFRYYSFFFNDKAQKFFSVKGKTKIL